MKNPTLTPPPMKTSRTLLAIASLMLVCAASGQDKIPSATVQTMNGQKVNANTWNNDGKPMIVNFWATWCAPCKRELSAIADVYDDWQEETGVKLMAVSIDDTRSMARVAPYVNGQAWDFEVYMDPNADLKRAMNVNNIPHTFLVDGSGQIVWQHNNYQPGDEIELYKKVKELAGK